MEVRPKHQERKDEQEPRARATSVGKDQPEKKYEERIGKALGANNGVTNADDERNDRDAIGRNLDQQDCALFLLDVDGRIVRWYSGAARTYGYPEEEVTGKSVALLSSEESPGANPRQELNRSAADQVHSIADMPGLLWSGTVAGHL